MNTEISYEDEDVEGMNKKLLESFKSLLQAARNNNKVESSILYCDGAIGITRKLEEYKIIIIKKEYKL